MIYEDMIYIKVHAVYYQCIQMFLFFSQNAISVFTDTYKDFLSYLCLTLENFKQRSFLKSCQNVSGRQTSWGPVNFSTKTLIEKKTSFWVELFKLVYFEEKDQSFFCGFYDSDF